MTQKLPVISGQECVRALQKAGFIVGRQSGSHIIMRRVDPPPTITVVVPNHRTLDRGTLRAIVRQAGLDVDQFTDLLK